MSMKTVPCSGYVLPVRDLIPLLPENKRGLANAFLDGNDDMSLQNVLQENLPNNVAVPFQVFTVSDQDDVNDDMETGETYALFDEADLYEKKETPQLEILKAKLGKVPTNCTWGVLC